MFAVRFEAALSPAQIDRLRWALFPEVRIPATQGELFAEAAPPLVFGSFDPAVTVPLWRSQIQPDTAGRVLGLVLPLR